MPSIINAATSGGLISTADTSGVLQLQTASTTALTITAAQNIGIGTASPVDKLSILSSSFNGLGAFRNTDVSSGAAGVGFSLGALVGTTPTGGAEIVGVLEDSNSGRLQFQTRTSGTVTEKMRIPAAGGLQVVNCVSVGNATPAASGAGITFPATQSASSDANTLDDYEEGEWTATLLGLTTNPTTPVIAGGTYTKIGRSVTVNVRFNNVNTTGASGQVQISGLPFPSSTGFMGNVSLFNFNFNGGTMVACYADTSGAINFLTSTTNAPWNDLLHNAGTGRFLWLTVTYFV